ncbi:glycosyltransferase [Fluviispira vulneris]|uniref:glycosyltransferase n=1 Tax=Fluviispira vulneris TaxID=2763012 RepID=UPI00164864DD|nr:glycosyltransferase [Fluviispira vulneris]
MKQKIFLMLFFIVFTSCAPKILTVIQKEPTSDIINDSKIEEITYNTSCIAKYKTSDSIGNLQRYQNIILEKAVNFEKNYSPKEIVIKFLGDDEIVEFYSFLQECKGKGPNIFTYTSVEAKDTIQRRMINEPHTKEYFRNALTKYSDFNFEDKNIFYTLVPTDSQKQKFSNSKIDLTGFSKQPKAYIPNANGTNFRKLNVLQASLEAHNVSFAGVSTVLDGLINGQISHKDSMGREDINPFEITPFYDILKRENLGEYKLVGYLKHFVDGEFYLSTIYQTSKKSKINQFLIQPDPDYCGKGLCDIGDVKNLYNVMMKPEGPPEYVYFVSAVSAFAALYNGGDGSEMIDVLHSHSHQGGFANVLLKRFYLPLRAKAGLPPISTVYTVHAPGYDFGLQNPNFLGRVGLEKLIDFDKAKLISLHVMSLLESDVSNSVSKGIIKSYTSNEFKISFGINNIYEHLISLNRFAGIPNGINFEAYNPRNEEVLGQLKVDKDLSNLMENKEKAKKILFDLGIISSPTKPLYLYVGRMVEEKGVDHFKAFAEYVTSRNGQVVFMGPIVEANIAPLVIELKNLNNPDVKVYNDIKKGQLEIIPSLNIKKGNVIRFASDFTFIPSKREPFGLVALEALILGNNVITSNVEGLSDITVPYDPVSHNVDTFNSIIYNTYLDEASVNESINNMIASLDQFDNVWNTLTFEQKSNAKKRSILHVEKFKWNAPGGSNDQYKNLYLKALSPLSKEDSDKNELFLKNYKAYSYQETL